MSSRACNVALGCLVAVLFAFCVSRSRHELRWSAIAYADAENIIAATHFVKEGFKAHYFLNYHTPGYLGKARRNVSSLGYDSQYPPFGEILNAMIIKCFGENLFVLRVTGILFSCLALLLFYGVLARFFDRQASLFGTAFIALSVSRESVSGNNRSKIRSRWMTATGEARAEIARHHRAILRPPPFRRARE